MLVFLQEPQIRQVINAAGAVCNNITINTGATLTNSYTGAGNFTISGNLVNSGTINNSGGAISIAGNWTSTGTFTAGNGVDFTSSVTQTVNNGASSFGSVTHSGTGTLQLLTNNLVVTNAFNNSGNGTLDLAQRSASVGDLQGAGTITNSTAATTSTLTVGNGTDATTRHSPESIQNGSGTVA
jgi:hypothetical protein